MTVRICAGSLSSLVQDSFPSLAARSPAVCSCSLLPQVEKDDPELPLLVDTNA